MDLYNPKTRFGLVSKLLHWLIALGIIGLGIIFTNAPVVAPAINTNLPPDTPNWFPLLFVTIACGAISGFHGLVSSGTSSKQLDKETDARYVGYGGAVGEGSLALTAILATTAGFAVVVGVDGPMAGAGTPHVRNAPPRVP